MFNNVIIIIIIITIIIMIMIMIAIIIIIVLIKRKIKNHIFSLSLSLSLSHVGHFGRPGTITSFSVSVDNPLNEVPPSPPRPDDLEAWGRGYLFSFDFSLVYSASFPRAERNKRRTGEPVILKEIIA